MALVVRTVVKCSVEFLHTNGIKPHVVFNLKAMATQQDPNPYYKGVRLSMEWEADDLNTGTFQIKPLPYIESSRQAHGAFDFTVRETRRTVYDWIQVIRGRSQLFTPQQASFRSDLTAFRFVETSSDSMDGCRDFM